METKNYYDTLSKVQKQKWAEKQGNLCYYKWFDTFYKEYTLIHFILITILLPLFTHLKIKGIFQQWYRPYREYVNEILLDLQGE